MARRRIYTRKRTSTKRRVMRGTAAAIVVAAILYFAVAGGLGTWIADRFILPNMGGGGGEPSVPPAGTATQDAATPAPTPAPTPTTEQSEEIAFEAMPFYAIQLGAFANEANAEAEAERFRQRGAAGYLFHDTDRTRVLASAYLARAQADDVRDQLLNRQGVESYVLDLYADIGGVTLRITAPAARVAAVRDGLAGWKAALGSLEDIAARIDTGLVGPELAREELTSLAATLEKQRAAIADGASVEDGASAISGLQELMGSMSSGLSAISAQSQYGAMEISSQIKYTYIDSLVRYGQLLRSVSALAA